MTTAHRATWKAARGGLQEEGSFRLHVPSAAVSSKDAPTELNLKLRPSSEPSRDELRARIDISEQPLPKRPRKSRFGPNSLIQNQTPPSPEPHLDTNPKPLEDLRQDNSEASDSEAESDDDEADLLAELEKIRREREFDRAKKQAEEQEIEEQQHIARAAVGNPLVNHLGGEISDTASIATGSVPAFAVRRRWNDDVIFRNEASSDRNNKQRFINDTIRNDFHRKFMKRHVK